MIWSCTPYNGEADVLEIRLGTLEGVVDRHVVCEANVTQRGVEKPFWFEQQVERFAPWIEQISYLQLDLRGNMGYWTRERTQRDEMLAAVELEDDDVLLVSDVDEIPDPRFLDPELAAEHPVKLEMTMHMYYLNWVWREKPVRNGTRATLISGRKLREASGHGLTQFCEAGFPALQAVAGWPLAYQLDGKAMREKIANIADDWCVEWAKRAPEHFEYCRRTGWDLFDRPERQCDWVPDWEAPPYALDNRELFAHMFIEEPAAVAA